MVWEYFKQTYTCFLDLEKQNHRQRESKNDGDAIMNCFGKVKNSNRNMQVDLIFKPGEENLVSWMSNSTGAINPPLWNAVFEQHRKIYEAKFFRRSYLPGVAHLSSIYPLKTAPNHQVKHRTDRFITLHFSFFAITIEPHPEFGYFIRFAKVFEK